MNQRPDNWDAMTAIQKHEWHVEQCRLQKQVKTPGVAKTDNRNWQHQRNARHTQPVEELNGNAIQKQYFYWSTMVKEDAQRLRSMPDHAERDKSKIVLLNKYRDYLREYMDAKETHDNNVLFYCLVWACDCEQWDWAIQLCDYATETKQTNDIFRRGHEDFCTDSVLVFAEKSVKAQSPLPDCFIAVFERILNAVWTVDNITQSKYYKLMGDALTTDDPSKALSYFKRAHELNDNVGVKTRIKELTNSLNN